jgi:peptide subunit release factor 1 (eRF1)
MQTETRSTLLDESRFDSTLRQLIGYHSDEGVLSVYLDIDPATATREGYEAALIDLWKPLHARQYDDWTRGRLEYEVAAVTDAVRGWRQPPGRSVAMFFSGPGGLRTILPLQFPIRSVARFESRPVVSPLIAAMEEHRRYCVVVFDKERARIITVFLGAVEEEIVLRDDVPGRTAAGGWGQANYARHRDQHVDEHARRTVEHLWAADRSRPIHALILGGPDEALAVLRRTLPPSLSRSVVDTMPVEMFADTTDIVNLVAQAEAAAREREDMRFVEELIADAGKGAHAAAGWSETLQALSDGRVHRLVLTAGVTRPGVMCPEGHFLATSALKFCPLCSETLWQTDDIAEAAVRAAMLTDAQVRFLSPRASDLLGERGIAAQLRY